MGIRDSVVILQNMKKGNTGNTVFRNGAKKRYKYGEIISVYTYELIHRRA